MKYLVSVTAVLFLLAIFTINSFAIALPQVGSLEMPATGGIGTTIFYTVGGILMVGAVILLVTKKRMNTK